MKIKKKHIVLLAINILSLIAFGIVFFVRHNYEFMIYVVTTFFFLCVIAATFGKVRYCDACLLGLTIWAILHLAGGAVYIKGIRLYEVMIFTLSDTYPVLRFDQAVHIWGFGAATITMYCLLRGLLKENLNRFIALSIVVTMAGLGIGALNEIIEFVTSELIAESGVGGYMNTSLDLVADLLGAILAMLYIRCRYLNRCP